MSKQHKITFNNKKINLDQSNFDPTLQNSLFGAVKLTKNSDIEKYKSVGYGIGFN